MVSSIIEFANYLDRLQKDLKKHENYYLGDIAIEGHDIWFRLLIKRILDYCREQDLILKDKPICFPPLEE